MHIRYRSCNRYGTEIESDGKDSRVSAVYRKYIEKMKKITKQKNEDFTQKDVNDLEKISCRQNTCEVWY